MSALSRFVGEPLVHFVLIGVLIFVLFGVRSDPRPDRGPGKTIVVEPQLIEQLEASFEAVWLRAPNDKERRALIEDYVREEIYYREALELGLDRNDVMVRKRLRQKMEFLTDSGVDVLEPENGDLEAHLLAHPANFGRPPLLSFEQVFLGETVDQRHVELSLGKLEGAADPSTVGVPTGLPHRLSLSTPAAIDGVFGPEFSAQVQELPPDAWAGPVTSAYGVHLVRALDVQPAQPPPLDEVYDAVLADWKASKAAEVREQVYERLREEYVVEINQTVSPTEKQ